MCAAMPGRWSYRRDGDRPEVEYAFWSGTVAPGMALHFHPQIQLTAVLAGGRTFQVGHQIFTVLAGQCLYIPAGMPHKSLPVAHEDTRCLNIYLDLDGFGAVPMVFDLPEIPADAQSVTSALPRIVACLGSVSHPNGGRQGNRVGAKLLSGREPLSAIAARNRLSREGFSRQFTRMAGIPPNGYRLVSRLNEARQRLRGDVSIAELAAELDFADQSHFGRHFRRVFGVSPDAYRRGMR
jgi:AraC-like DNA-binding protein